VTDLSLNVLCPGPSPAYPRSHERKLLRSRLCSFSARAADGQVNQEDERHTLRSAEGWRVARRIFEEATRTRQAGSLYYSTVINPAAAHFASHGLADCHVEIGGTGSDR
jgi:hypothetical protein